MIETRSVKKSQIPKVSIIVPVYNSEKYLADCIKSLLNQTFKDIEIICVNDGSNDGSLDILNAYKEKDDRIVIVSQQNLGPSSARNAGVKTSKGEYIIFIDSDDWIDSNYIEKLYAAIIENNCDIALSSIIRKRPKSQKYRIHYTEQKVYSDLQQKLDISKIPKCCYACAKLFKKDLIKNRPFKSGAYFEDVLWTPYVIKDANAIITVDNTYYYYRVNTNSIVKSKQSLQKQHDNYVAKKKILKFYEKNHLIIDKKYKHITKSIKYFFNVPILKTKEYKNKETLILFGFLPIWQTKSTPFYKFKKIRKPFFIKKLDNHIYIDFLGLHTRLKTKYKNPIKNTKICSLNKEKRTPALIVSLTSYPKRIGYITPALKSLLNQSLKADRLILWLSEEQFKNKESDLPVEILELKDFGLEIKWCEDLRSYKKLIPALKEFPKDIIVTADDDLYYQNDWLESLYKEYLKNPKNIYTRRACRIQSKGDYFTISPHYSNNHYDADFSNQLMGGAGTLYPPDSLYHDIFDTEKIKNLIPTYDDIYFWAMAVLKGTKIGLVKNKDLNIYNVENAQIEALCKTNINVKEAFNLIFEQYPELLKRIANE